MFGNSMKACRAFEPRGGSLSRGGLMTLVRAAADQLSRGAQSTGAPGRRRSAVGPHAAACVLDLEDIAIEWRARLMSAGGLRRPDRRKNVCCLCALKGTSRGL